MRGPTHAAVLLLALACCAPIPVVRAPAPPPPATALTAYADLEQAAHRGVNRHRASRGLPALAYDERLARIAREHSAAMASGRRAFGHEGFDERTRRITAFLPLRAMAENVAYDQRERAVVADAVVEGWIESPGHRENIVGDHDVTGIGVARSRDGRYYFTQVFVGVG